MDQNERKVPGEKKRVWQRNKQIILPDPNGMYTGRPLERYEQPVQDADDL